MPATESEFKGHPTLELTANIGSTHLTFGVPKAKLILANIEAIKAFVAKHAEAEGNEAAERR